jgi:hypothetical protein
VIVMHTKSNFINQGQQLWDDPTTRQQYVFSALKHRRRISTEGMRVRAFLAATLANNPQANVIVLGDLNDGPGPPAATQVIALGCPCAVTALPVGRTARSA